MTTRVQAKRRQLEADLQEAEQREQKILAQVGRFRRRLIARMDESKLTAAELARRTGADPGSVSRYCGGLALPNAKNLALIADLLGCSADHLLGRE